MEAIQPTYARSYYDAVTACECSLRSIAAKISLLILPIMIAIVLFLDYCTTVPEPIPEPVKDVEPAPAKKEEKNGKFTLKFDLEKIAKVFPPVTRQQLAVDMVGSLLLEPPENLIGNRAILFAYGDDQHLFHKPFRFTKDPEELKKFSEEKFKTIDLEKTRAMRIGLFVQINDETYYGCSISQIEKFPQSAMSFGEPIKAGKIKDLHPFFQYYLRKDRKE